MPQLAYHVSDLQQKTSKATVHDLVHANKVTEWARQWALVDKQKLKFLPFKGDVSVGVMYSEHDKDRRRNRQGERLKKLGLAAVHDASWGGQPAMGSHGVCVYFILRWGHHIVR